MRHGRLHATALVLDRNIYCQHVGVLLAFPVDRMKVELLGCSWRSNCFEPQDVLSSNIALFLVTNFTGERRKEPTDF